MVTDKILATSGHGLNMEGNSTNTFVYVGKNGSLDGIQGREITISNRNGASSGVDIDDHNRGGTRTATFDTITSSAQFVQLTDLTPGPIYTQFDSTQSVTVHTGIGMVTDYVRATGGHGLNLEGNSPNTFVYVGNNGSLDGIQDRKSVV